jgi:hypothetical protein
MGQKQEGAAAEVDRLTRLRDAAEKGSAEHRELNPPIRPLGRHGHKRRQKRTHRLRSFMVSQRIV